MAAKLSEVFLLSKPFRIRTMIVIHLKLAAIIRDQDRNYHIKCNRPSVVGPNAPS